MVTEEGRGAGSEVGTPVKSSTVMSSISVPSISPVQMTGGEGKVTAGCTSGVNGCE